ncbi:PREDICTED: profilin-4-like [Amphimedon queenslandica]|uniref:Profilin n=1 Tax=Amphimedon queenslandica TaxID=400682 RepID=A0AAN0IPH2_AMPQE|nr:PREDICTED: profilin-4-like [Amphimedon queenslandica]|eukprot:XP_011406379.1 PREDICTED: profilin-4-like [Amphimedon queenslandica]
MSSTHQQLLQEVLTATGNVETCCLIRKASGSVKAASIGFEPSKDLVQSLVDGFNELKKVREEGIDFNGASYQCVRADNTSIYGKKGGGSGFIAVQTKQYIIYGSFSTSMYPSITAEAIHSLGDYYKSKNK